LGPQYFAVSTDAFGVQRRQQLQREPFELPERADVDAIGAERGERRRQVDVGLVSSRAAVVTST
jgi:hypothetical protein